MGLLDGRVAIVTGASRGIGAEIARRFAAEGAAVAVAARTTQPGTSQFAGTIAETAGQIKAAGGTAIAVAANLSLPEDRERLVAATVSELGQPDILVSNAAVTYFTRVEDFTAKHLSRMAVRPCYPRAGFSAYDYVTAENMRAMRAELADGCGYVE